MYSIGKVSSPEIQLVQTFLKTDFTLFDFIVKGLFTTTINSLITHDYEILKSAVLFCSSGFVAGGVLTGIRFVPFLRIRTAPVICPAGSAVRINAG